VYLVWGEFVRDQPILHVSRSEDAGAKWCVLTTVMNAKNPGLAMTANGTLGFLYQQVVTPADGAEMWMTKLERTRDDFRTVSPPLTLATFPVADVNPGNGQPELGDYLHLMSVKNDFYGIFSASNVPDQSRFPCGPPIFQRRVDFKTKTLLGLDGKPVCSSIDPFFFKVTD
jgi:hypothetical protein